jgi:hypothetical protein
LCGFHDGCGRTPVFRCRAGIGFGLPSCLGCGVQFGGKLCLLARDLGVSVDPLLFCRPARSLLLTSQCLGLLLQPLGNFSGCCSPLFFRLSRGFRSFGFLPQGLGLLAVSSSLLDQLLNETLFMSLAHARVEIAA